MLKSLIDEANYNNKDKGKILNVLKKNLKNKEENLIIQYYDLRDTIIFNISFLKNTNELKFIDNFINLIFYEFLNKKVYKKTKIVNDIIEK